MTEAATPPRTVRFLDRPEGRIAYEVAGSGPLVVCVPGMGELRSSYRHTVPALVAVGFSVATVDLRGHGDSDATFTAYDDVLREARFVEPVRFLMDEIQHNGSVLDMLYGKYTFVNAALARHYGKNNSDWAAGNFTYTGTVGFGDLVVLARNYGQAAAAAQQAAVAQPAAELLRASNRPRGRLIGRRRLR